MTPVVSLFLIDRMTLINRLVHGVETRPVSLEPFL